MQELIALAKNKPGQLSYASSGFGGLIHLNYEMFKQMTGAEMTHVPYKGTSFFQADLYEGRVQVSIDNVLAHLPHIAAGKVRGPGRHHQERARRCCPTRRPWPRPACPASNSATNYMLFAPKGSAGRGRRRTSTTVGNEVIKDPDFRERMLKLGIVPSGGPQAEAAGQDAVAR